MFRSRSLTSGWKEEVDEDGIVFHNLINFEEVDYLFEDNCEQVSNDKHTKLVRTFLNPMLLNIDIPLTDILISDSFVFTLMCYIHQTSNDYIIRDYKHSYNTYIYLPKENSTNLPRFFLSILNTSLEEYLPFTSGVVRNLIEKVLETTRHENFLTNIPYLKKCLKVIPRYDRMEVKVNKEEEEEYLYIGPYYFLPRIQFF